MIGMLNFTNKRFLPLILQTEVTECGLASMAMIAKYYGHNVDLNGLRSRYPASLRGSTLETLSLLATQLDLSSRAVKVDLEKLHHLQCPAILHWNLNHFVVLKSIKRGYLIIHDPAEGVRKVNFSEASDYYTGVALELLPNANFEKQTIRRKMKLTSLWGRLIGLKRAIVQTLLLSLILQIIVLASPFYLQLVVDEAVVKFDTQLLFVLALGFGALAIINTLTTMMRSWVILYFGHQMSFQLVSNIFRHLMSLPTDYFEKRHVGDIISRMGSTEPIQTALTRSVVTAIIDGLMAIITGIVIFIYSPILGVVVVISVILLLAVTLTFYPILRKLQEETIITEAKNETHVIESIKASTTIKLFSAENKRVNRWRNLFADTINAKVAYGKYEIFNTSAQEVITGLQTIIVVFIGANLILKDQSTFTVGMLFAFMSYRTSFTQSISSLLEKLVEFRLLNLHLDRIADITQTETEVKSVMMPRSSMEREIEKPSEFELRNVRFRYSDNDPWVIDGVNLKIESGEFVALTGPSGGGKTTLMKLMLGLYLPTEGQILIDGHPLTEATRLNWRENFAVVMQDDQLLAGSISDNIAFFDPDMDIERVHIAAKYALIHEEIMTMPMNYLSMIGDMGSVLSGGQKQRVLLARALYRGSATFFLDEGTANIDLETEKAIVDVIENLPSTRIVIAHRQEFLNRAQKIVHLKDGKVF